MRKSDFRDLQIWQKSKALCIDLYRLTNTFPDHENLELLGKYEEPLFRCLQTFQKGMVEVLTPTLRDFSILVWVRLKNLKRSLKFPVNLVIWTQMRIFS